MKKHIYIFALLIMAIQQVSLCDVYSLYPIIEQSDTDTFRKLLRASSISLNKDEKKAFLAIARRKIDERKFSVDAFTLKDAGRLALAAYWIYGGTKGLREYYLDQNYRISSMLQDVLYIYLGLECARKAVTHYDNKIKYDRALAIEAMLRQIKPKQ